MKKLVGLFLLLSFILLAVKTQAVTLSLVPSSQTINQGDIAVVDLSISGLGDSTAPSLGAFLIEITFVDSTLSNDPDSVTYGLFLGDPDPSLLETEIITTVGTGSVSLDEFSFLSSVELDTIQPAEFTLATLLFSGDNIGTSTLGFGTIDMSDAVGVTIVPTLEAGEVTVVPLPASLPLLLSALGCLLGYRVTFRA